MSRLIEWLARAFAFAGGSVLVAITGMSVTSIVGRAVIGKPVPGDFELVQLGCAACIAAFLPYCQLKRGNIIVDFFTTWTSPRSQRILDAFGALALAAVMALIAWRTGMGAAGVRSSGEGSMILGFPIWIGYAAMVPSFALTAVVALHTAIASLKAAR